MGQDKRVYTQVAFPSDLRSAEAIPTVLPNDTRATEINQPAPSVFAQHDVFVLDVPVADAASVQERKGVHDLAEV